MILTSYYNPLRVKNREENYYRFKEELGHELLTIECAFGNDPFTLKDSVKLRAESVLWQKERLIRIGERLLPNNQDWVVWLDCDILFDNKDWLKDTIKLLKEYNYVQPFETVNRRNKDWSIEGTWKSFGERYSKGIVSNWFDEHGHTGFAFATKRDKFDLYDKAIGGTADHLMFHAMVGQLPCSCVDKAYGGTMRSHFYDWAKTYAEKMEGSLHYTEGTINHLYHGALANRNYLERTQELTNLNFNPYTDLYTNDDGLLELNRPDIQKWVLKYFESRKEDV